MAPDGRTADGCTGGTYEGRDRDLLQVICPDALLCAVILYFIVYYNLTDFQNKKRRSVRFSFTAFWRLKNHGLPKERGI